VYALFLVLRLALVLNIVYLVALAFMRGRHDNDYGAVSLEVFPSVDGLLP
jgi:hypothetical protein